MSISHGDLAGLSKLEEVKDQYPEAFEIEDLNDIARYLFGRDKKDEAKAIFKWIIDSDAESVVAWAGLGRLYFETGRNKESFEFLQKTVELDPENSFARMSVPWIKESIEVEENPVLVTQNSGPFKKSMLRCVLRPGELCRKFMKAMQAVRGLFLWRNIGKFS